MPVQEKNTNCDRINEHNYKISQSMDDIMIYSRTNYDNLEQNYLLRINEKVQKGRSWRN